MLKIAQFELKYYIKNASELLQFTTLFISIMVIGPLGFAGVDFQSLSLVSLWIALIVSATLNSQSLFKRDADWGLIDSYQTTKTTMENYVLAKWASYWAVIAVPLALIFPIVALIGHLPPEQWEKALIGLLAGSLPLSLMAALMAAMMSQSPRGGALLSLLVLPLTVPIIIFGGSYLASAQTELLQPSLLVLLGLGVFFLPIYCVSAASCVRAAN